MSEPAAIHAAPDNRDALVSALALRASALGFSHSALEEVTGLALGHVGKIFGPSRVKGLGLDTLYLLLPPLGLKIVLLEDPEAAAQYADRTLPRRANQARANNFAAPVSNRVKNRVLRHLAKRGGQAYKRKTTKKLRALIARHAAMCRHYPDRVYDWPEIKRAAASTSKAGR